MARKRYVEAATKLETASGKIKELATKEQVILRLSIAWNTVAEIIAFMLRDISMNARNNCATTKMLRFRLKRHCAWSGTPRVARKGFL